jgi:hypothetical protein
VQAKSLLIMAKLTPQTVPELPTEVDNGDLGGKIALTVRGRRSWNQRQEPAKLGKY